MFPILALFRMGLSPMRTPKSLTGRAVQVRALCPWCPHCEHRLGPSPAAATAPPEPEPATGGGAAGGTPSRVMAQQEDWLGLVEVRGIFFFSLLWIFFYPLPDLFFLFYFWERWAVFICGKEKRCTRGGEGYGGRR